jgi:hypothetical protein
MARREDTNVDPNATTVPNGRRDVIEALDVINKRRREIGMRPLEPTSARWTDEDILLEAKRLQTNPARRRRSKNPRERLLAWYW